jgi:hypothetical protein
MLATAVALLHPPFLTFRIFSESYQSVSSITVTQFTIVAPENCAEYFHTDVKVISY